MAVVRRFEPEPVSLNAVSLPGEVFSVQRTALSRSMEWLLSKMSATHSIGDSEFCVRAAVPLPAGEASVHAHEQRTRQAL